MTAAFNRLNHFLTYIKKTEMALLLDNLFLIFIPLEG